MPRLRRSLSRKVSLLSSTLCLTAILCAAVSLFALLWGDGEPAPLICLFFCALLLVPAALRLHLLVEREILSPLRLLAALAEKPFPGGGSGAEALSSHVRGLVEDMQRSREALAERDEALRRAEKLALVGKLAAGVAHSVRNPLTSVKLRLFSLTRSLTNLSDENREDFRVISEQIQHLDNIVRNFLEFSRRPPLRKEETDCGKLLRQSLALLSHRLQSQGVKVEIRVQEGMPAVKADPDRIKEAFVNLALNACEAMGGEGTLSCELEAGVVPPWGHCAVLRLRDSGPGVPEELRERVFQPFFSGKAEGTGLGLPIARRIFEEHGGWLSLASSGDASGATFVAGLPAHERSLWVRY
jgi:signal transduction histidine kinase